LRMMTRPSWLTPDTPTTVASWRTRVSGPADDEEWHRPSQVVEASNWRNSGTSGTPR
jgi:hypothetical protein